MTDPYCYPHSDTMKNKLKIRDKETLLNTEIEMTSARIFDLQKEPMPGKFDYKHLCNIHKHIFGDLFDWAGEARTVDISKGNTFCPSQFIEGFASDVFRNFSKNCHAAKDDKHAFAHTLAEYYADLNALHPFREGNGRTQREFARELCLDCGYVLDLTKTKHQEMLYASQRSLAAGDNSKLEEIFNKALTPVSEYKELDGRLRNVMLILSSDDLDQSVVREANFGIGE